MSSAPEPDPEKKPPLYESIALPQPIRWARNVLGGALWGAFFTQWFVMDVAAYLVQVLPWIDYLFRFRLLAWLGIAAALVFTFRVKRVFYFIASVVLFPLLIPFWLSLLLVKNWPLLIIFSPALYSMIKSFRRSFGVWVLAVASSVAIWFSTTPVLTITCMAFLVLYLTWHYYARFTQAFSSSTVFADGKKMASLFWRALPNSEFMKPPKDIDPAAPDYKQKFNQSLLQCYLMYVGLSWLGDKLSALLSSRKLDLYFVCALVYTLVITLVIYALLYLGVINVQPQSFSGIASPSLFDLVGLSVSGLIAPGVSPLHPESTLALWLVYAERFTSFVYLVLLVFVIRQSMRERHQQDFDAFVADIRDARDKIGDGAQAHFALTIAAAEVVLLEVMPDTVRWAVATRVGEENAKLIPGYVKDDPATTSGAASAGPT